MATPTLGTLNLEEISTAESVTNWTLWDTLDPELFKEGSNAITGTFRADLDEGYYDHGSAPYTAVNKHLRMWLNFAAYTFLDIEANGGMELMMYDGSVTERRTIFGSDTYFGGWLNLVIDCNLFTTLTLANVQRWGCRFNRTAAPANKDNFWCDYIRYLDGIYATGGTSGDKITMAGIASQDADPTNGYGVVLTNEGVYFGYGKIQIGNGATTTYFEMEGAVLVYSDQDVASNFYEFTGDGSGCNIAINNSVLFSSGSAANTRFVLDMSDTNITLSLTNSFIRRAAAITFASGQTVTGNTFVDCGQITHAGADMDDCAVEGYEGTADTAALIYNVNADPDGEMDRMSFTKGTASTHAIEFGSTCPTTMTLRNIDFSGYNASNGQTDSTLYFSSTGAQNYTINLIGCSGNISYKTHASFTGTVTLVVNPVTLQITVKDPDGNNLTGARVRAEVSSGTNWPHDASVTISRSGTTATVTHTSHGLSSNDWVKIKGAEGTSNNAAHLNGVRQITVTGANTYTYTCEDSGDSGSISGTIVATLVIINATTAAGVVSASRTYATADQPFEGVIAFATTPPYYRRQDISGTIDKDSGLSVEYRLQEDE
jgi:hypothetical protein